MLHIQRILIISKRANSMSWLLWCYLFCLFLSAVQLCNHCSQDFRYFPSGDRLSLIIIYPSLFFLFSGQYKYETGQYNSAFPYLCTMVLLTSALSLPVHKDNDIVVRRTSWGFSPRSNTYNLTLTMCLPYLSFRLSLE